VLGNKVAVAFASDFPHSDVLPAVLHVLLVKPHSLTINPTRPMNEDGWVETYEERHVPSKISELVWLVTTNLQHSNGHARRDCVGRSE
jgi:hypothetical protein